jgi:hypothetical protein
LLLFLYLLTQKSKFQLLLLKLKTNMNLYIVNSIFSCRRKNRKLTYQSKYEIRKKRKRQFLILIEKIHGFCCNFQLTFYSHGKLKLTMLKGNDFYTINHGPVIPISSLDWKKEKTSNFIRRCIIYILSL